MNNYVAIYIMYCFIFVILFFIMVGLNNLDLNFILLFKYTNYNHIASCLTLYYLITLIMFLHIDSWILYFILYMLTFLPPLNESWRHKGTYTMKPSQGHTGHENTKGHEDDKRI